MLIDNRNNRTVLIEITGGLRDHNGILLLKPLLADATLTSGEILALACSPGVSGAVEAIGILTAMKKYCPQENELMQEIDIIVRDNGIA